MVRSCLLWRQGRLPRARAPLALAAPGFLLQGPAPLPGRVALLAPEARPARAAAAPVLLLLGPRLPPGGELGVAVVRGVRCGRRAALALLKAAVLLLRVAPRGPPVGELVVARVRVRRRPAAAAGVPAAVVFLGRGPGALPVDEVGTAVKGRGGRRRAADAGRKAAPILAGIVYV